MSRRPADPDKMALLRTAVLREDPILTRPGESLVETVRNDRAREPHSQTQGYLDIISPPPSSGRAREVDLSPSKGPRRKPAAKNFSKVLADSAYYAKERIDAGEDCKEARDLVGLYAMLHEKTFGVLPLELGTDWQAAVSSAGKLLRDEFGGDAAKAERFVAWCWKRVRSREKRRGDDEDAFRPGWRMQFKSRAWLTDYRVSLAKRNGR